MTQLTDTRGEESKVQIVLPNVNPSLQGAPGSPGTPGGPGESGKSVSRCQAGHWSPYWLGKKLPILK